MSVLTIVFGLALMAVGAVGYLDTQALTALIPGYFGIPLCVLGFLGLVNPPLRKHVLHGAVLVTTIGLLLAGGRLAVVSIPHALAANEIAHPKAFLSQVLMVVLCAGHVGLSVKSFLDARRRRKQAAEGSLPG